MRPPATRSSFLSSTAAILIIGVVAISGCSRDLNRRNAKALISKELDKNSVTRLAVSPNFLDCATTKGVFRKGRAAGFDYWELTSAGKSVVAAGGGHFLGGGEVQLLQPARQVVTEITGIAESSQTDPTRQVNFRWAYDGIPETLKPCASANNFEAMAMFQKYDDGWRVENISNLAPSL